MAETKQQYIAGTEPREKRKLKTKVRKCRYCGCTDDDCKGCVERTGRPCYWVSDYCCSACLFG